MPPLGLFLACLASPAAAFLPSAYPMLQGQRGAMVGRMPLRPTLPSALPRGPRRFEVRAMCEEQQGQVVISPREFVEEIKAPVDAGEHLQSSIAGPSP